jgi:hypothetical protein
MPAKQLRKGPTRLLQMLSERALLSELPDQKLIKGHAN